MTTPIVWFSDVQRAINSRNETEAVKFSIRELIVTVSALVEAECNRRFDPYYATYYYNPARRDRGGDVAEGGYLLLERDLLTVTQIINDSTVEITAGNYALFPLETDAPAKNMIKLKNSYFWHGTSTVDNFDAIHITGFWGGYGGRFQNKTTITAAVNDSQSTIPVDNFTGLEAGAVLKIDSELMQITSDPTTKTVYVERAYNGTEAVTHAINAPVYLWRAGELVRRLVTRIVKWQAALDDNPLIALVTIGDSAEPIDISSAPSDVQGMISLLTQPDSIRGV